MGGARHLESLRDRLAAAHAALACRSGPGERRRQACAALRLVLPGDFPTEEQRGTCRLLRRYLPPSAAAAPDPDDLLSLCDCTAELLDQLEAYLEKAPVR
jgi:hypothetical protein